LSFDHFALEALSMTRAPLPLCLVILVSLVSLGLTAACSETATPAGGALSGEVEVRIVDHFDGSSERSYRLIVPGAARGLRLAFAEDPGLAPGTQLSVWGSSQADGQLRVAGYQTLRLPEEDEGGALGAGQRALIGAPAFPKRKLAFVLVDLGGGLNITAEQARAKAFGMGPTDQSMKQVVLEYSFGRLDLEGEVVGPFKTTMTGCDEDGVAERLAGMVPAGFDNVVYYFGQKQAACGWAGVAPLGRNGRIAGRLWVNGTASCRVATHEFGHNLGLQHAARLRCTGTAMLDDLSKCTSSEYGDSADVMGDGCNHFNGYSKAYLSWFEKCNGVVAKSAGSYTLLPVETACDGTQVLFVPMPKPRTFDGTGLQNYALELRAPLGLDSRFAPPTVMVRLVAPVAQMRSARMTWIIDTNPATPAIDGLRQGESFMDPAGGVGFTIEAISATSATVKVTIPEALATAMPGGPTCLDGTPFTAPSSLSCASFAGMPAPPVSDAGAGPADAGAPAGTGGSAGSAGRDAGGGSGGRAGTMGSGGSATGGRAGTAGSGGSTGEGGTPSPSGPITEPAAGCGCDVAAPPRMPALLVLALLMMLGLLVRRR
jgi:hypothetical protein